MDIEEFYSRLCRLITHCLPPDCEFVASSITPEIEKDLLISLSQVFGQIKQWILELESDSDEVSAEESEPKDASQSCFASGSQPHEHHCLENMVAYLISFISIQKPLIQHLAAKILVAISEFSSSWETHWEEYIQLLCCWLKFALRNLLSSSVSEVDSEAEDSEFNSLISVLPRTTRLQNLNYVTAASILRVLRDVLKLLRSNGDVKLLEMYLELITDTFSHLPWDLLNEVYAESYYDSLAGSGGHNLLQHGAVQSKALAIFHGNLVQLCCSLVDVSDLTEAEGTTVVPPVISQIKDVIPKLVHCITKPENLGDARICHYLRHKILMLLIRLVAQEHLECSDIISWLHIIESYFQDLLLQPLERVNEYNQDSLEGSPFWADDFDAERYISSRHLQRLVVFFLLRCSLILENLKEKADKQLPIINPVSCTALDLHMQTNFFRESEGVSVFHKWLMRHLPTDIFVDHREYLQGCTGFAQSFLKLFMHEDDLLFEMLLQLFSVPRCTEGIDVGETLSSTKKDFIIVISDLLNPVLFFHLFLAEIVYDHQVLLDYLISKDTGARSAEYLLKCLRIVCNSWKLFVEFPAVGKSANSSRRKRQKFLANAVEFQDGFGTTLLEDDSNSSSPGVECKEGCVFDRKNERVKRISFMDAKCCLLSLKTSISSLNRKHLFPYNPEVLLRRGKGEDGQITFLKRGKVGWGGGVRYATSSLKWI
ncbi:OLC1v1010047C2 [Oldenlandia corymbosa var. corymbosa]|uniref:OLC1v1010047C2 n=1 Tax=Oldenlandia corymbosa var. corymbosa TaxID=529605 RepID=A0AAV1DQF4_OLDCO|nr:OLC1v1010047C2 [Oldenlandia corymbosa var. corymbosa]